MLVIRAPNHLGDFVMALPALHAAQPDAVLLPNWLAALAGHAGLATIPFERGRRGFPSAVASLRRRRFERGVLLTPSFSSAALFYLAGVADRRGTNTDSRSLLLNSRVDRELLAHHHRASVYMLLTTGNLPAEPPVPVLPVGTELRSRFRALVGTDQPLIGIFPGSNATSRRWPVQCFAAVARELSNEARVVVFGSEAERNLTSVVAGDVAIDLGGRTDLPTLAAGIAECDVFVTNDSGPMHLSYAVGTRTVTSLGAADPVQTGPPPGHRVLRHSELPCVPCVRNVCPRSGKGTFLEHAYMECLDLISVDDMCAATLASRLDSGK